MRFRGREVKRTGDGFLATFDGPARAVRCASAIADTIQPLGLAVRGGLHTGEIDLRGDAYALRSEAGGGVVGESRVRSRFEAGETPLVGRVEEIELIQRASWGVISAAERTGKKFCGF